MKAFLSLFLVLGIYLNNSAKDTLFDLIPQGDRSIGLKIVSEAQSYIGNNLFSMIDGGAEVYLEYGFLEALSVSYLKDENNRIEVQLFKMKDAGSAYGVLTHSRSIIDGIVESEYLSLSNPYYIMFQKSEYFGIVSWSLKNDPEDDFYKKLVDNIAKKIKGNSDLPIFLSSILKSKYTHNQLTYLKGNLGLSGVHFFSHKNLFQIEEAIYLVDNEVGNYFLFNYSRETKCNEVLAILKEEFSSSDKLTNYTESDSSIQYTDRRKRVISIFQIENKIIVGINNESNDKLLEIVKNL